VRYGVFADLNYREPRGNPRRGGQYSSRSSSRHHDVSRFEFRRFKADLQQYIRS
jgi:hypothetical protein